MVVLVTGGSGFIGSHIVDELVKKGHDVRVFDKREPVQKEKVDWIRGDLLNPNDLQEAGRDVNYIFHLAAIADVNIALTDPKLCVEVNEIGTINLLNMARTYEVERVILASSTWVYGEQSLVNEESPIPLPKHVYTKTKIGQEHLVYTWNQAYDIPYTILRYDIPYGPRMRQNLVLAIFVRRAEAGDPITIYGDGKQGRCFIYVSDLAEGNVYALKESGKNQIFNLADSKFVTINNIVDVLKRHYPNLIVNYAPARPGDFKGVKVDISKAEQVLGWKPRTSFEEGVSKYLQYLKTYSRAG